MSTTVRDVTAGAEPASVAVSVDIKSGEPLPEFTYTSVNVLPGGSPLPDALAEADGCACRSSCDASSCPWLVFVSVYHKVQALKYERGAQRL